MGKLRPWVMSIFLTIFKPLSFIFLLRFVVWSSTMLVERRLKLVVVLKVLKSVLGYIIG